jgi:Nucleotide modification associated domain 1
MSISTEELIEKLKGPNVPSKNSQFSLINKLQTEIYDFLNDPKTSSVQFTIAEEGFKVLLMLLQKNRDYGSSVFKPPMTCPDLPPETAVMVRVSDKFARLSNLQKQDPSVKSESIRDTITDIAGYMILLKVMKSNCISQDDL